MMRVMLIDDERPALRGLEVLLKKYPDIEIAGTFNDPFAGIEAIGKNPPDAVFLDINMPQLSGMDTASAILDQDPSIDIVFVTAYDEYAIGAFELDALDYLLKPLTAVRLDKAVDRLRRKHAKEGKKDGLLQIRTLGRFEIGFAGREAIKWRSEKTRELFAYLLFHAGRDLTKEEILDALWQNDDPEWAVRQLYNGIYYIRKALSDHGIDRSVLCIDGNYCMNMGAVDYDIDRFCSLYKDRSNRILSLAKMEGLYVGEYLAGQSYGWAVWERERLLNLYIQCVVELSGLYMNQQRASEAEVLLLKAYRINPFEESVTENLLLLYQQKGSKAAAERHFAAYCALLKNELNTSPPGHICRLVKHTH